jgi:hypothetical protein
MASPYPQSRRLEALCMLSFRTSFAPRAGLSHPRQSTLLLRITIDFEKSMARSPCRRYRIGIRHSILRFEHNARPATTPFASVNKVGLGLASLKSSQIHSVLVPESMFVKVRQRSCRWMRSRARCRSCIRFACVRFCTHFNIHASFSAHRAMDVLGVLISSQPRGVMIFASLRPSGTDGFLVRLCCLVSGHGRMHAVSVMREAPCAKSECEAAIADLSLRRSNTGFGSKIQTKGTASLRIAVEEVERRVQRRFCLCCCSP